MEDNCKIDSKGEVVGLLMTYRCNLDCKYCYISHKGNRDMSLTKAKTILEPFLLDEDSGWLDIMFVGAETLMAIDVIKPLVEWAESQSFKRKYRFCGSTNGTLLTDELKGWLSDHRSKVILGLSYDGLPSTQEENRGRNDIDLDFFIKTWPQQSIQMTIDAESVRSMAEGVIYLLEKGAVVHPNVAFEDTEWPDEAIEEYANQLNILAEYYNSHEHIPVISQFVHNLKEYADAIDAPKKQMQMCGAGHGYQVFDVDGSSYPCHMISPLVLEGKKLERIKDGYFAHIEDFSDTRCSTCLYTSSCPTCLACNYLYRDDFVRRDDTHCRIMQVEVQAFVKKEVFRLNDKGALTPEDATEVDAITKLLEYWKKQ